VKQEMMDREILTSRVLAESNATQILTLAQANTTVNALSIEKEMCKNVKSSLGRSNNDFLLNFIWVRLLEKKITDGVDTSITMELPEFD
jgi:hypothetical protein